MQEGVTTTRRTEKHTEVRMVETNEAFRRIQQCLDWIEAKQTELDTAPYGSDLDTTKEAAAHQQRAHREVADFRAEVERCKAARNTLSHEEQRVYNQYLSKLEVAYSLLQVVTSDFSCF